MNIRDAKQSIKQTIQMYLQKNQYNQYKTPIQRQRPIFLYGPPGIGKTEIVSQVCNEMGIGLINYTITHHTRQSAIGLPSIHDIQYGLEQFKITEYTLSEIINSVYDAIHNKGTLEGVLFIDEINCVSESLAPAMLDLLQNKKFGPHKIPEGWVLVTAGNPLEFNRSAREFDMVTLDRLKKIEVDTNFEAWKKYAYKQTMNEAVISFLNVRENYLFKVEKTSDGLAFATPRGWEDLSVAIDMYHELGFDVKLDLVSEYIQHGEISKEFYRYYLLHQKYKRNFNINQIMSGHFEQDIIPFKEAVFDEKLAIIEVLLSILNTESKQAFQTKEQLILLMRLQSKIAHKNDFSEIAKEIEYFNHQIKKGITDIDLLNQKKEHIFHLTKLVGITKHDMLESFIREFKKQADEQIEKVALHLTNTIEFILECHGESQELVAFIVNVLASYHMMRYMLIRRVPLFDEFNSKLVSNEKSVDIMNEIATYEFNIESENIN